MQQQNQAPLAVERLGRLMGKYSVPCIISLLVGALYNIVDQIFIANADYLGSYGNAANTVVFPLTVIALAVAVMIGDGCCAFVSLCVGKNKPGDAAKSMGNAVTLTLAASAVITAVYLVFMDGIIGMFGGTVNAETFRHSREYFFWISIGIPFYMFGQAMNPIIRADGSPKFAMISTVSGAVINIILDPIMIYGLLGCPQMGMAGAAIFFRGCDDPIKLKSIKPPFGYIGILWIEERDQLSSPEEERSIKQSVLRGGALSYDFASYNPPKSRDNWVNKQLREPTLLPI